MTCNITKRKGQHPAVVFCGVAALIRRLSALAIQSDNPHISNEIKVVVTELQILDNSLHRLRHERSWVDKRDVDQAIERLRCIPTEDRKKTITKPSNAGASYSDEVHTYNVAVCAEIGGIAECNAGYTEGISRRIAATGKKIEDLRVRQLLEIHLSYGKWFNSLQENEGVAQ